MTISHLEFQTLDPQFIFNIRDDGVYLHHAQRYLERHFFTSTAQLGAEVNYETEDSSTFCSSPLARVKELSPKDYEGFIELFKAIQSSPELKKKISFSKSSYAYPIWKWVCSPSQTRGQGNHYYHVLHRYNRVKEEDVILVLEEQIQAQQSTLKSFELKAREVVDVGKACTMFGAYCGAISLVALGTLVFLYGGAKELTFTAQSGLHFLGNSARSGIQFLDRFMPF